MPNDFYETLGVAKNASDAEIKKAYKRKAMKFHPDRNQGDDKAKAAAEEKFKEVNQAYEVLSDSQKRAAYDQFGHAGVDPSMGGGAGAGAGGFNFSDVFGDIFGDVFSGGGGRGRSQAQRGADLLHKVDLTLEQAVDGANIEIKVPTLVACDTCKGSGAKSGKQPENCSHCQGSGQVRLQQGPFMIQQTCPHCRGEGKVIKDPCTSCQGRGRKRDFKTLSVKVPAGVDTGDRVRLSGEGEAGERGGPSGDLYVEVQVKQHAIFDRQENHLYCEVPVSFVKAALGGEIDVPTLHGKVKLKIQDGTQSGKLYRVRGKGVKSVRGSSTGDLLCRVQVETPVNLNAEQQEFLKQFDLSVSQDKEKHNPKAQSWFNKVKSFMSL